MAYVEAARHQPRCEPFTAKGNYYLIYKPDPYDAARGIWKVTV